MKILVIGSGGREHAVCDKFKQSAKVSQIFALPGNAGISDIASCVTSIKVSDHKAIIDFCKAENIAFVFVGPEQPLVDGLVDDLQKAGIRAFGPSKFAAQLEGSKAFMKKVAFDNNVPTAVYDVFEDEKSALEFAVKIGFPCVVKADGLAAGKGVVIVQDIVQLKNTLGEFFAGKFGDASKKIILEEFLEGVEVSHFTLCDGKNFIALGSACDHKKVGENETGPNTGGMGTFSPSPFVTAPIEEKIISQMVKPTLDAMAKLGHPFQGILFAGVILTKNGPKLLEFNTRFGDPETQVILPRIKSDFCELIENAIDEKLAQTKIEFEKNKKFVCVVMCAKGYPENYEKGTAINIDKAKNLPDVKIFHAGTALKDGKLIANGGRVLNIVGSADSFKAARQKAYEAIDLIEWKEGFARRDIGKKVEENVEVAKPEDVAKILEIMNQNLISNQDSDAAIKEQNGFLTRSVSEEEFRSQINDAKNFIVLVSKEGESVNGYLTAYDLANCEQEFRDEMITHGKLNGKKTLYYKQIAKALNAKNVGSKLVDEMLQQAKTRGFERIMCRIVLGPIKNQASISFHEKLGFKLQGKLESRGNLLGVFVKDCN